MIHGFPLVLGFYDREAGARVGLFGSKRDTFCNVRGGVLGGHFLPIAWGEVTLFPAEKLPGQAWAIARTAFKPNDVICPYGLLARSHGGLPQVFGFGGWVLLAAM